MPTAAAEPKASRIEVGTITVRMSLVAPNSQAPGWVVQASDSHMIELLPLGQDTVLILGRRDKSIARLVVGTGAITHLPSMYELGADAILATDDGMNFWDGGLWAVDLDVPLLIVNHCTAEKPGMRAMAAYLKKLFPDVPVEYIDVPFPYTAL